MDLEPRALRPFLAVADSLHFGRAAETLRIAQPALSQQIRRLERDLGVELFVRTSRSVALTPAGRVLRDRARALLAQGEKDAEEVVRVARGEQGRLDVGFVSSALPLGPVRRVQQLREEHPLVRVHLTEGWTAHLLERLDVVGQAAHDRRGAPVGDPAGHVPDPDERGHSSTITQVMGQASRSPRGGAMDDVSQVKKFELTEEEYDKRDNTYRAYKKKVPWVILPRIY